MSYSTNATKNKQQKHPKVFFEQYLNNSSEPKDNVLANSPPELQAELLENRYAMRRHLRYVAKKLRKNYS